MTAIQDGLDTLNSDPNVLNLIDMTAIQDRHSHIRL